MTEAFARERLRRDWIEVLREPSSLVAADPLPENLFEWHANLRPSAGIFAGVIFHVRITFPKDYPNSPPFLHFPQQEIPSFHHPNLYSFGLCLDILSSFIGRSDERAGWSPAYTVRTLLMQLQSFLFEFDAAPQDHGGNYSCRYSSNEIQKVRKEAGSMVCKACGHCRQTPRPALQPEPLQSSSRPQGSSRRDPLMSYQGLQTMHSRITGVKSKLRSLTLKPEAFSYEACDNGAKICHAKDVVAHLTAVSSQITVRILALNRCGGLRLGIAALGCTGLTDGMEVGGSVAWDSEGKLVLGKVIHKAALPRLCVGDEVSVAFGKFGFVFTKNGERVFYDAPKLWPKRPLEHFLFNQAEPTLRGTSGHMKDMRAMLSFRNASLEVIGNVSLQDEVAEQAKHEKNELLHELDSLEKRLENIHAHLRGANERVLKMRDDLSTRQRLWTDALPKEMLILAFMGVDADDVPNLMRVCCSWRQIVVTRGILEKLQLCCFYTKASPSEDVLGFGISAEYHDDGNLKALSTELDVLSWTAFSKYDLRRGVWGDNFKFFVPLVLDGIHAKRAMPHLEICLAALATGKEQILGQAIAQEQLSGRNPFEPWMALAVLPQLMNSFAVSLMNAKEGVSRHSSEKALLGYCSFHHMILALAARYTCIAEVARAKLHIFIHGRDGRLKSQTPDLGQLLVYCAIVDDVRWENIAAAIVQEASVRSVLWMLRDKPRLEVASDAVLVREAFQARLTGLRLLMFQAFFLRNIARLEGNGPREALTRYGLQYGLPTHEQKESLFRAAREILAVNSWPAYYARLGLPSPTSSAQAELLRRAFEESAFNGYHVPSSRTQRKDKGNHSTSNQPRRTFRSNERVGVKMNLQQAFKKIVKLHCKKDGNATLAVESISNDNMNVVKHQKASNQSLEKLELRNKFAALELESDSDM